MKIVCICASNILHSGEQSVSKQICHRISNFLEKQGECCDIIDLRKYELSPCIGCGKCFDTKRCCRDRAFNSVYEKLVKADAILFVSAHYAPIPAKLCMVLEKMEEIAFLHWWKDSAYCAEMAGRPVGIISHGGGSDWAIKSYSAMVNDTIANALDTIQCRVVPHDSDWPTGISIPVSRVKEGKGIFPIQEYDWANITPMLEKYIGAVLRESKKVSHK